MKPRPSVLKRQREQAKREKKAVKAEKKLLKKTDEPESEFEAPVYETPIAEQES